MKIRKFIGKDGREWFCGTGTPEEVDRLNIEKDFNTALHVMQKIRRRRGKIFHMTESETVDRSVYGWR